MPIKVECPGCGKTINAPDSAAGQTGNCPACRASITVPAAVDPPPVPEAPDPPPEPDDALFEEAVAEEESRERRCLFCGETIQPTAKKCPHCCEYLDPTLRSEKSEPRLRKRASSSAVVAIGGLFILLGCIWLSATADMASSIEEDSMSVMHQTYLLQSWTSALALAAMGAALLTLSSIDRSLVALTDGEVESKSLPASEKAARIVGLVIMVFAALLVVLGIASALI